MRVRLLYFGVLKESLGRESEMLELADGACVEDVMARFEQEGWTRSIAVAVNREYARREDVLRDGDEVALLPPVSGGAMNLQLRRGLNRRSFDYAPCGRFAQDDISSLKLRMDENDAH
ncbi:MAG: MoaD/ThiS family protein [Acidobacteria bacterium]|nr:MoaD/ThiS family protein [Acidobacteriota bacterium]